MPSFIDRRSREEREQNRSKNYGKSQTSSFVSKDSVSNFNFKNNRVDAYVRKNIPPFQANDFYSNAKGIYFTILFSSKISRFINDIENLYYI